MEFLKELESLTDKIKHQRDEIKVKIHLAGMEAKDEWEKAEEKFAEFKSKAEEIKNDTQETTEELVSATRVIGDEIGQAYKRIIERLKA
ncbi:MAG: hypothetical protein CVV13_04630 [Gammaproteobacteria bacterium HGW-Gammaproteobacteria-3]|jgi:seryl-tRNA synthetase|nr:MAG: hypothetical protein CVV13_04630 [Gammaproteobacteria bacterium HGW-Gammaproteobacteria-3]